MEQGQPASVLQRMIATSLGDAPERGRSLLRALRLGFARAASEVLDLPLAVIGATQSRAEFSNLEATLQDDRLLMLLDGKDGRSGAVSLDANCVGALIRHQTFGQITAEAPDQRPFTATDAALCAPLIEAGLARAAELSGGGDDRLALDGLQFGSRVDTPRSLVLAFDAVGFRQFDLTMDIGNGTVQGAMTLILPDLVAPECEESGVAPKETAGMEQKFGLIRADLNAVVCRLRIPLRQFTGMKPGDVLPLIRDRWDETSLVAVSGQTVATGRLGQIGGLRAVRLNEKQDRRDPHELPEGISFVPPPGSSEEMAEDPAVAKAKNDASKPDAAPDSVAAPDPFMDPKAPDGSAEVANLSGITQPEAGDPPLDH